MILLLTFLILVVAPALILGMGRLIADRTEALYRGRQPAIVAAATGDEWYRRPMQPTFSRVAVSDAVQGGYAAAPVEDWYRRPLPPLADRARLSWRALCTALGTGLR